MQGQLRLNAETRKPAKKKRKLDGHEMHLVGLKRSQERVTVVAAMGGVEKRFIGTVTDFDRFSITLSSAPQCNVVIFKHAVMAFAGADSFEQTA